MEHKRMMAPNLTSQTKGIPRSSCVTDPKTAQSSGSNYTRPFTRENFQRRNFLKSSASASETSLANSTSAIRCQANKINRITHSYTTVPSASSMRASVPAGAAEPCVTKSNNVARCHATKAVSYTHSVVGSTSIATSPDALGGTDSTSSLAKRPRDIPRVHATSTSSVTPLTKVAPLIDNSKPTEGNEQRSSNIEIIKMLHEKKRSMREQMSDDPKMLAPSNSRSLPSCSAGDNLKPLPKEGSQNTKPSPSCSRGVNLPVAVVKPSPQISSAVVVVPVVLPAGTFESQSPVKSIASGIIDVHSCNTQEFKRVRSESNAHNSKDKTTAQNFDKTLTGASGDRDQQRKLVRILTGRAAGFGGGGGGGVKLVYNLTAVPCFSKTWWLSNWERNLGVAQNCKLAGLRFQVKAMSIVLATPTPMSSVLFFSIVLLFFSHQIWRYWTFPAHENIRSEQSGVL